MSSFDLAKWLMQAETPTIRYLTAKHILKLPENDPQVQATRQAIMNKGASG